MNKLREWMKGKLKRENMIVLALSGILLMVIAIPTKDKKENKSSTESVQLDTQSSKMYTDNEESKTEDDLSEQLEQLLGCMEGVGKAEVMITYSSSPQQVVEKDIPGSASSTSENDSAGGNRSIRSEEQQEGTVYVTDGEGNKMPYIRQTVSAKVAGVTVICEGGDSPIVQKNITEVAEALFGIEAHKIKVAKMVVKEK